MTNLIFLSQLNESALLQIAQRELKKWIRVWVYFEGVPKRTIPTFLMLCLKYSISEEGEFNL